MPDSIGRYSLTLLVDSESPDSLAAEEISRLLPFRKSLN